MLELELIPTYLVDFLLLGARIYLIITFPCISIQIFHHIFIASSHSADGSAKALGLKRLMEYVLFIKNAAMTTDVLAYLKKLSLFFQKSDINVADAQDVLQTTIDNMLKLKTGLVLLSLTIFVILTKLFYSV